MKVKDYFKHLNLIHKGIIGGILLLIVIVKSVVKQAEEFPFNKNKSTFVLALTIILMIVSSWLFKKKCTPVKQNPSLLKKLKTYKNQFVIQMVLLQIAMVLNVILWMLGGANIHLYITLMMIVYTIAKAPAKEDVYKMVFKPDEPSTALEDDNHRVF